MSDLNLHKLIDSLPPHRQQEVADFAEFLIKKEAASNLKKERKFGFAKGFIKYMAPDFDEPLDEFKDYM